MPKCFIFMAKLESGSKTHSSVHRESIIYKQVYLSCYATNSLLFSKENMLNNERCLKKETLRACIYLALDSFCFVHNPQGEPRECQLAW